MNNDNENSVEKKQEEMQPQEASDFEFLQERIKERPINKKKLIQRTIITASLALVFGGVACFTFLLLEPVLNNWLYPEEEPKIVIFPQEEDEMLPEDMLTEDMLTQISTQEGEVSKSDIPNLDSKTDAEENQDGTNNSDTVNSMESSTELSTEENSAVDETAQEAIDLLVSYREQYDELYGVYQDIQRSMVTVTAVHSEVDLFNNEYESEGSVSGVVIANNEKELLILTQNTIFDDAEDIIVCFGNGLEVKAKIKQTDGNTKLAVLAVDLKYISASNLEYIQVATLGSSAYAGLTGTPIIAIGNLYGQNNNVCYGIVTSNGNPISLADNEYRMITTDIYAKAQPSGILINLSGEVIGLIDNTYNNEETKNLVSAIGITELKGMITMLSNQKDIPYLGIYVKDISKHAKDEIGVSQGAYIVDIDMDSPAMLKGIQKGDIIIKVGSQEILNANDYMNVIRSTSVERNINVIVLRSNVNVYEEMQFTLQPIIHPDVEVIEE